jgi:hypothetical protein
MQGYDIHCVIKILDLTRHRFIRECAQQELTAVLGFLTKNNLRRFQEKTQKGIMMSEIIFLQTTE